MATSTSSVTYGGGYITGPVNGWCTSCTITQEIQYEDQAYGVPLVIQRRYVKRTKTTMTATVKVTGDVPLQTAGNAGKVSMNYSSASLLAGGGATMSVTGYVESVSSQAVEGGFGTSTITVVEYS